MVAMGSMNSCVATINSCSSPIDEITALQAFIAHDLLLRLICQPGDQNSPSGLGPGVQHRTVGSLLSRQDS